MNEFDELSENGTMGMPEYASPEKGEQFLQAAAESVVVLIDEMQTWHFQEQRRVHEKSPA
jgi:creatinine amidohydrolase/Fe(II)-dependent formamide hydrolase-like protein